MDRKLGDEFSNRSIQLRNPDGQVRKVGNSYSGGNVTGDVSLVDANGQALSGRMRGGVSVLGNAQDAARTSASLRNPDGSYWSAGDNAIMAANLRDGVDPYLGTSRAQGDTANQDLLRLATSPGKVGGSFARQMLLNQVGDQTTRRGQDITSTDKPIWMNDPRFALVSHLKQFVFAFQETILKRVVHEFKHGNYTPSMALASYIPIMLAADMIKGALVSGGEQPEWQKGWGMAEYLEYAWQRAGLYGVGQFPIDVAKDLHRGGTGIGALTGPTIEQLGDVVGALGGKRQFGPVFMHSMPANALYSHYVGDAGGGAKPPPMFDD
jgi:hypothetical protein